MTALDQYATRGEAAAARRIIKGALARSYSVSVNDGEEWTLKRSTDAAAILGALATTGQDWLRIRDADGEPVGVLLLVWGNAADGSELVADCTDTPATLELAELVERAA